MARSICATGWAKENSFLPPEAVHPERAAALNRFTAQGRLSVNRFTKNACKSLKRFRPQFSER
jgi:hypothetical protein